MSCGSPVTKYSSVEMRLVHFSFTKIIQFRPGDNSLEFLTVKAKLWNTVAVKVSVRNTILTQGQCNRDRKSQQSK